MDGTAASTRMRGAAVPQGSRAIRALRSVGTAWTESSAAARWFTVLLVAYVVLTAAVVLKSPVVDLDAWVRHLRLRSRHRDWYDFVHTYVMLGQRGPTTLIALPWFFWIAHRRRSVRPLVMLGVALAVLNVTVAIVKYATGRLTPRQFHTPADAVFQGGNIYPSGHISNCVVLYGLIALIAAARYRRVLAVVAGFITVTVGAGTVFINTHWVTDVFGGIFAGGLVLTALPWLVPPTERWWLRRVANWRARRAARAGATDLSTDVDDLLVTVPPAERSQEMAS